jgi:dipeptidyl aminopeptidase/acylaminoacyl peptidase
LFLRKDAVGSAQARWASLTARPGLTATARFMPDGEGVVYSSTLGSEPPTIQSIRIGQVIPKPLGTQGQVMAVAGDGSILFIQSTTRVHPGAAAIGTLSEFLVDGTEARPILEHVESADRSRDGKLLAVVKVETAPEGRRNHLECPPGRSLHATSGWLYSPRLSPDGNLLSVLESQGPDSWVARVRVLDLQGRTRFLSEVLEIQSQAWSPDGRELLLTRTPGIVEAMDLNGHLRPLLSGPNLLHLYDVSQDGRLLVASYQDRTEVFVASEGKPLRALSLDAWAARLSADGSQLLFTGPGPKGPDMTYLQRMDGKTLRPIAPGRILGAADDASVVLLKRQGVLYRVPTGPGSESAVPMGALGTVWRAVLLPDARRIAVVAAAPGRDFQLHVVDPGSGQVQTIPGSEGIRQVVPVGPETVVGDALDGSLRRFSLDGGPGLRLPGSQVGDIPLRLRLGGEQLFVQEASIQPGTLRICTIGLRDGQRKHWQTLTFTVPAGLRSAQVLSITPDGRSLAYFTWAQPNNLFTVAGLLEGHPAKRTAQ